MMRKQKRPAGSIGWFKKGDSSMYELALVAAKIFPAEIDDHGFANETAVTRDFSALLTSAGIRMSHADIPTISRTKMLADKNMTTSL